MEKRILGELAEKYAKKQLDDLEMSLDSLNLLPSDIMESEVVERRNRYAREILKQLVGVVPEVQQINKAGTVEERKALYFEVVSMLADRFPILAHVALRELAKDDSEQVKKGGEVAPAPKPESEKNEQQDIKYEALTPEEIASLPEKVREELRPFLELHRLLDGFDDAEADEIEAIKELIKESFDNVPKVEILKLVVRLKMALGGLGNLDRTKLVNFLNGVVNKAKIILNINQAANSVLPSTQVVFKEERMDGHNELPNWIIHFHTEFKRRYDHDPKLGIAYLLKQAEIATKAYISSTSGTSGGAYTQLLAIFKVLKEFGKNKNQHEISQSSENHDDYQLLKISNPIERQNSIDLLRRKATEVICFGYIEHVALKMGNDTSMTSDWEKIVALDKEDRSFDIHTFDSMMQPDRENRSEGIYTYQYSDVMKWAMLQMPIWVREFSYPYPYDDKSASTRNKFNAFVSDKILEALRTVGESGREFISNGQKVKIRGDRALSLLNSHDLHENADFDIFLRILESMSTALSVRLHTFRVDLARGATPGGGVNDQKRWIVAVCPYAHFNYKCYKELTPHLTSEGFELKMGPPVKQKGDEQSLDEKIANMNGSISLTRYVIDAVAERREPIYIGDVSLPVLGPDGKPLTPDNKDIKNIYPDLYEFVVKYYDRRSSGSEEADLQAWFGGLLAVEKFVSQALGQPLGTSDREKIASMDPEEASDQMADSLGSLIRDIVSPLKTNQKWVEWGHISQFILMYIDKMYRVYRLIDDSFSGAALFTRKMRIKIELSMANLGGVGDNLRLEDEPRAHPTDKNSGNASSRPSILGKTDYGYQSEENENTLDRKWDMRDYLMNRIARAKGNSLLKETMVLNYSYVDYKSGKTGSITRAQAASRGGVDALIRRRGDAFRILKSKVMDKMQLKEFYKASDRVLFGTPTEEQKKTADDKK